MKREIMETAERLPDADENFVDRWSRLKQQSIEAELRCAIGAAGKWGSRIRKSAHR